MGKAKKTRRFAEVKRLLAPKDARVVRKKAEAEQRRTHADRDKDEFRRGGGDGTHRSAAAAAGVVRASAAPAAMFFRYNSQLGPPFYVLIDTNFINFSIKNKLEMVRTTLPAAPLAS